MRIQSSIKPAFWGAVGGGIVVAVIGFGWGGWVTGGSASLMAKKQSEAAVAAVLAPICVEQFQQQTDSVAKLAALKATSAYKQADFIEEGGWATMVGSDKPTPGTAKACAEMLKSLTQ